MTAPAPAAAMVSGHGSCKICSSRLRRKIDRRLQLGEKKASIVRLAALEGLSISKPTLLRHAAHATHPMTTFAEAARRRPTINRVTADEFLDSIIDAAAAKAEEAPEMVTLDHGLRASQVRLTRKQDEPTEAMLLFVRQAFSVQRHPEAETIEGEFRELPSAEEDS